MITYLELVYTGADKCKPINVLRVQPVYTESYKFRDRLHYSVTLVQINFSTDECFACATRSFTRNRANSVTVARRTVHRSPTHIKVG